MYLWYDTVPNKEEETMTDKKHFNAYGRTFDTYDKAEEYAKRLVGQLGQGISNIVVYEAVAAVKAPMPAAEVTKL